MKPTSLPYTWTHPRSGIVYFRRHGKVTPIGRVGDAGFIEAYAAASRAAPARRGSTTVEALIASYVASSRWERLSPRSRKDYAKVLDFFRDKIGNRDVSIITRPLVIEAMEANRHRAGRRRLSSTWNRTG